MERAKERVSVCWSEFRCNWLQVARNTNLIVVSLLGRINTELIDKPEMQ
jgi:hypothetical protein